MVIPPSAPILLTRNLLYTGITRAKKLLIVIGSEKIVDFMIKNVDSKKRNTGLEYKMEQEGEAPFVSFVSYFVEMFLLTVEER